MFYKVLSCVLCEIPCCVFCNFLLLYSHKRRITLSLPEAIPPHLSLIVHSIMTRKESKVIVMIALGSLFFWRLKGESSPFWSPFFIFWGILELQDTPSQALLTWSGLGGQVGED